MFCPHCGKENVESSHHCVYCGKLLRVIPGGGGASSKSRLAYILLAVFLGVFGVHNFYAGHTNNGLIQLLLTLIGAPLTCGVTSLAVWVWNIVEICTVSTDGDGVPMS